MRSLLKHVWFVTLRYHSQGKKVRHISLTHHVIALQTDVQVVTLRPYEICCAVSTYVVCQIIAVTWETTLSDVRTHAGLFLRMRHKRKHSHTPTSADIMLHTRAAQAACAGVREGARTQTNHFVFLKRIGFRCHPGSASQRFASSFFPMSPAFLFPSPSSLWKIRPSNTGRIDFHVTWSTATDGGGGWGGPHRAVYTERLCRKKEGDFTVNSCVKYSCPASSRLRLPPTKSVRLPALATCTPHPPHLCTWCRAVHLLLA